MTTTTRDAASGVVLAGWAAKGLVYLALSWLVLRLALGSASQEASAQGALRYVAQTGGGRAGLLVLAVGLVAYAAGRVLEVTVLARGSVDGKDRVAGVVLAVAYTALALSAFTLLGVTGGGSSGGSGGQAEKQGSALLLGLPGGRWIVGAIGVGVIGLGAYSAWQGVRQRFLGTLRTGQMSPGFRRASTWLGTAAYVTKGAVLALLGWFFLQSAVTYDPERAEGLDGALQEVAQQQWGRAVLVAVAVGLLAYALFSLVEARYRRVGVGATGTTT